MDSKLRAQHRCDQIEAFNEELNALEQEGIFELSASSKEVINAHHTQLIDSLSQTFDIDATKTDKQLSRGMRIASFLGALAFAASIFFLFYQYWGLLGTVFQTVVLVASPLISLSITAYLYKKEKSGYFAKIGALITVACFVLNLSMMGVIYNLESSPNAFLLWSVLALGLAYKTQSRLMLAFAILFFASFLSARTGTWFGYYWLSFGEKPENFFAPAISIFCMGFINQKHYENFAPTYRIFGIILLLLPILSLSHWSGGSYFDAPRDIIEGTYQVLGFVLASAFMWIGIRNRWNDSVNTGCVFFTIFLYTKFFDWWWDWFPKYLFFLVIALSSLLILLIFKRLRTGINSAKKGEGYV